MSIQSRRDFLWFLAPLALLPVVGPSMLLSERPPWIPGHRIARPEWLAESLIVSNDMFTWKEVPWDEVYNTAHWNLVQKGMEG